MWQDKSSQMEISLILLRSPMRWSKDVSLAPVLFNLFFTCVLNYTVQGLNGVYICSHFDGSVFNICQPTAKTKALTDLNQAALFANDCALMAHKSSDLQTMLNRFSDVSKQFGLTISLGKTKVLFQPAPNSSTPQPTIPIDGVEMKTVKSFKYLGSIILSDGQHDKEISVRISKASQALWRLCNRVLTHHYASLNTNLKVYRAVVLTSLLCGCESLTIYHLHIRQLEKFHMQSLHSSLDIQWQDKITNLKVLGWAKSTSIKVMLLKAQLFWAGHIIWMGDEHIPKQLFFGELSQGQRK